MSNLLGYARYASPMFWDIAVVKTPADWKVVNGVWKKGRYIKKIQHPDVSLTEKA